MAHVQQQRVDGEHFGVLEPVGEGVAGGVVLEQRVVEEVVAVEGSADDGQLGEGVGGCAEA